MKKVYQTIGGDGKGNCFSACVAAILEMDIENVPNFCGDPVRNPYWMRDLNKWLEQFGLGALTVDFQDKEIPITKGYACAGIPVSDNLKHSVVYKDLKFVYNPDKKWEDFTKEPEDYTFFVVLDPAKYMKFINRKSCGDCSLYGNSEEAKRLYEERNLNTKYEIVCQVDKHTCEFCKQYNGFVVIGPQTLRKQMEIIQKNCTSESKCRCRAKRIEMYICPECRDLGYTNTSNGRRGFANTPGNCRRHPEVEMIEKEI